MTSSIKNILTLKNMGVLADRNSKSPSLELRRYNLIYGFNGSGKSTLSRLFASLEAGHVDKSLPQSGTFCFQLDDGNLINSAKGISGLEHRVLVFNTDFIENNIKWNQGTANPVFYIGAEQAEAAAELNKRQINLDELKIKLAACEKQEKISVQNLASFKRDLAKIISARLHQIGRKYEANHLQSDYDNWIGMKLPSLSNVELASAEERLRAEKAADPLLSIEFNADILRLYKVICEISAKTLSEITLSEIKKYPDMLLWIKTGHEYHVKHSIKNCLFCGNTVEELRFSAIAETLNNKINDFVTQIEITEEKLHSISENLKSFKSGLPTPDQFQSELIVEFKVIKQKILSLSEVLAVQLNALSNKIGEKRSKPATALDLSDLPTENNVMEISVALNEEIISLNRLIEKHNSIGKDFVNNQQLADEEIRKHFINEFKESFAEKMADVVSAQGGSELTRKKIKEEEEGLQKLRQQIWVHKPASDAINKIIKNYLGHSEIMITAVDDGYTFHRHGAIMEGLPSEGEKTAIALGYFISRIQSDGRKIDDLIVVIDDPISSLDTKAMNYACALIRSSLSDARQLIILTHNQQCMNEFRKAWKNKAKPRDDKTPTATFLFMDVRMPKGAERRTTEIKPLSPLLREYDSEYHFLFSHVLRFHSVKDGHSEYAYMMPNILRRVLEIFLAFKCPDSSGLASKIQKICSDFKELDRSKMTALERLAQVESHSDSLDDLIAFSSMTIEETMNATASLLEMMSLVDEGHLRALTHVCRKAT